jgi:hypothetical protein
MATLKALKEEARELGIKGYSKMNKLALRQAIQSHKDAMVDEIANKDEPLTLEDVEILTDWVESVKEKVDSEDTEDQDEHVDDVHEFSDDDDSDDASDDDHDDPSDDDCELDYQPVMHTEAFHTAPLKKVEEPVELKPKEPEITYDEATHYICGHCNRMNAIIRSFCQRCGTSSTKGTYLKR